MLLLFHAELKNFEEYLGLHLKKNSISVWQKGISLTIHIPSKLNIIIAINNNYLHYYTII